LFRLRAGSPSWCRSVLTIQRRLICLGGAWRKPPSDLSWLKLVPRWPADLVERCADVFGYGLFGGEGVVAGVDLDAAVAA